LSDLTNLAAQSEAVARALIEGRGGDLPSVEGGLAFLDSLQSYLDAYGWRADAWGFAHHPTSYEDPTGVLRLVGHYLAEPERSPRSDVVDERRADLARQEKLMPPNFLGTAPSMSKAPPDMRNAMRHFRGWGVEPSKEPNVLKGLGASRGVARGIARVINGLHEAGRLQPCEILVCRTTAPPWTPLFTIAGAVVTDSGGLLSHSAICAREYGIPCVVATQDATVRIKDGTTVTVDGTTGTVTLEEDQPRLTL